MDHNSSDNKPELIIVTLESSEYAIAVGASAAIVFFITNHGVTGDYFKVSLLGIPPGWITYPAPPAVWVPAGGQEKVVIEVLPPVTAEGITGTYFARLQVSSQSEPENGQEQEIHLTVKSEVKTMKTVRIGVEANEYKVFPGGELKIQLTLNNLGPETELLEIAVQGIPASWISLPAPVMAVYAGEQKRLELIVQVPSSPEIRAGYVPLKIMAASQKNPAVKDEVEIMLTIAAFESHGRVGVMLSSMQFSVALGNSLAVPITLTNRGIERDSFHLQVEGIPAGWMSTSSPVTPLEAGENKETTLEIRPPISHTNQAGRYKFFILVTSQIAPEQVVKVDCILTVAAHSQFIATLEPEEVNAGQPVSVNVKNEGNTQQVFHLHCSSQNDQLLFEFLQPTQPVGPVSADQSGAPAGAHTQPSSATTGAQPGDPASLTLPAGGAASFRFTARPHQRQLIGGTQTYPYQVVVKSQQQETPALPGRVIGRGIIPIWVLAVLAIFCLVVFMTAIVAYRDGTQSGSATQTWVAESTQLVGATQTVSANQTAAAIAGQLDSDGDGLTDQNETAINTNPYNPDTDADQSWDGVEVQQNTNPLIPDSDADGILDGSERLPCPDPLNPDSDQDGIIDGKDLEPCDANNPALTSTALTLLPTATPVPPTAVPTSTPLPVTPSPTSSVLPRFGGVILFVSERDGNPEIYALDDAGHIARITNNPSADTQAVWDSAMQRVAFTTNRDGQNEIYLMNADGTNPINLTNNPADDQHPAWSVDGQWITFTSNRDGNYEIYVLNLSDAQLIRLTNDPGNDSQPNWVRSTTFDASGESIIFTSDRDGNLEIYRMRTDGTEQTNLTANPASDQMAKASPDGALVIFTTDRDGNQEIYTMRLDGAGSANQTSNPSSDFGAVWSTNQAWIAFTTERDGNREVYITKTNELHNLTNHPSQDQLTDWR